MNDLRLGRRLMDRLAKLAKYSDSSPQLTRLYLSPSHKAAVGALCDWMREAGLTVSMDALATLSGRYEASTPGALTLLVGSHVDTVKDAGSYDGTLGILAALVAVEELTRAGKRLPLALEILAFGDEEGVRFPFALTGPRAMAGSFNPALLDVCDAQGISLRQALVDFGCDPGRIPLIAKRSDQILGYVELHIEQGPILEVEGLPVAAVSAINGVKRFSVEVVGEAGHAGTVPIPMRRDALVAAAEMIVEIERIARTSREVVATVGCADVLGGAVNVIPSLVRFTIDVRSATDASRDNSVDEIIRAIHQIAKRRHVGLKVAPTHEASAVACSPAVIAGLLRAIRRQGIVGRTLASGAGHDAMAMATLCPIGMLFVRCAGGISHNPAESISVDDAEVCVRVLLEYLFTLDPAKLRQAASH